MRLDFNILGTHCNSCKMIIKGNLEEIGAKNILIQLDEKKQKAQVSFEYEGDKKKAIQAIEKEGYKVA